MVQFVFSFPLCLERLLFVRANQQTKAQCAKHWNCRGSLDFRSIGGSYDGNGANNELAIALI